MRVLFTCLVVLALPSTVFAATFAKEPIFLSKSPVVEGETVLIHAVVSNDANTKFSGKLSVGEGDKVIGSVSINLDARGAQVASLSWKPIAGTHKLVATLSEADGSLVEENSATFTVESKEDAERSRDDDGDVESSADIQKSLAGLSPQAAEVSKPVFSTIDSLRKKTSDALDTGIDWTKKKGSVLGTSTESTTAESGVVGTVLSFIKTILFYIFSFLKYLVTHAALFYPILVIAFLYGLWRLYKRMRRPKFG